ncbi:hypothetical protein PoB_005063400 [Plakobranchus ocellatus]|uniref:SMB domain-containing protein n=1 Tax=Plakobranchus ocellatus TaxID=259542 RepID=A0AAV4BZ34_9GAST|nr:hypothetical protein PoB_005063400 [Plakobranchus ocellatus]
MKDLDPLVQKNPDLLEFLTTLCNETSHTCFNNCGARAASLDPRYTLQIGRVVCSCDVLCMLYGDCCWDFVQSCPAEVAAHLRSPLRHSRPVRIGYHTFLACGHDNSIEGTDSKNATENTGLKNVQERAKFWTDEYTNLTIKDVIDLGISGNVAVTDLTNGVQYRSLNDYMLLNPEVQSTPSRNRVLKWTPALVASSRIPKADLVTLVQNKASLPEDNIRFMFKSPSEIIYRTRTSMPEALITCENAGVSKQVRILNLTQVCIYVYGSGDFTSSLQRSSIDRATTERSDTVFSHAEGIDNNTPVRARKIKQFSSTKKRFNLLSTTENPHRTSASVEPREEGCSAYYKLSFDITRKPFTFSYLLDIDTSGSISVAPDGFMTNWEKLSCKISPEESLDSNKHRSEESKTKGDLACEADITCVDGMMYANGDCYLPFAALLQVHSHSGVNADDFKNAVANVYNFSKILQHSQIGLALDPASCFSNNSENGRGNNERISYYGIYYIFNLDENVDFNKDQLPLTKSITNSFNSLNFKNRSQFNTVDNFRLCFVGRGDNSTSMSLFVARERETDVIMQTYIRQNPADRKMAKTLCDEKPWAYREDAIFKDPNVKCDLVSLQQSLHRRSQLNARDCILVGSCKPNEKNKSKSLSEVKEMLVNLILLNAFVALIAFEF